MELTLWGVIFLLGLLIGSFLNVVIHRIPLGESILLPASRCVKCHTPLKWYHNIPVVSWLFLRGKCAFCHTPISIQYPMVELITGMVFLLLYMKVGLVWYYPFIAFTFAALLTLSLIDFKERMVPDSINLLAFAFALVQPDVVTALAFGCMAAGGLFLIGVLSSLIARREAMGGGDVVVAGTMGALLGFPLFFIALFLTALLALIPAYYNRKYGDDKGIPFIPFLTIATLITYLYDSYLLAHFLGGWYAS
jgi:leader peptidase (prepilin peptidase)/N-methyltransferase